MSCQPLVLQSRALSRSPCSRMLATSLSPSPSRCQSTTSHGKPRSKVMTVGRLNSSVVNAEYAVRGELAIRAEELRKELAKNTKSSHAFGKIINCNIGNPQQLAQKPITFFRQVSALIEYPALLDPSNLQVTTQIFPPDAIERAKRILADVGGSVGAYSHSQGIPAVRANVAKFIEERDGYPSRPEDIFLTAGASPGVQLILQSLISHPDVGIMIPIPQYPLYTASIALFNGKPVPYYLDESSTWGLSASELRRSITQAREAGVDVRALCVINPGNPTGSCLSIDNMRDILSFCAEENLMLLADEVYQANIYEPQQAPFHSFKKVLKSMGPECEHLELISFHSISKGMIGECGRRGGYFECHGIDPAVKEMFYKVASISLCPPVSGQVMVDLMVNPPRVGDPSYKVYKAEMDGIYESLKRRAKLLAEGLNKLAGVSCQPAQGAMYLFPTVTIPQKAIDHAKKLGKEPDAVYCMELLNATGVCVVPGSGFGQKNGTYHFRTTFLPPEDEMGSFISLISDFHDKWMGKWR